LKTDPPTNPDERSFADLLRRGAKELREQRGPCPGCEDLVAYHESRLGVEHASRVRDHVDACGLCDVQLVRLAAGGPPLMGTFRGAIWAFLRNPLVPYTLAVLLTIPAYRGLIHAGREVRNKPPIDAAGPSNLESGIAPVPSFSINTVRSEVQGGKSPAIRLWGSERFFVLSFFVPMNSSQGYRYEVAIVRWDEIPVEAPQPLRNCDKAGNCFLLCDSALFSSGQYKLLVTENSAGGGKSLPFFFEIVR